MATTIHSHPVEETRIVHDDDADSSSTALIAVLLVAAVLIIGFFLFALNVFPFAGNAPSNINIDVPNVSAPAGTTPDVEVN